jgi:NAD(P)-dependent dehydrogenase (short-subunit alcohol dehydrogenase family)
LWELLIQNGARVVSLSSLGHRLSPIDFADPDFNNRPYNKWVAYGQSKTANSLFAVHLDELGKRDGIRAFALHPGRILTTNLGRHMSEEEVANTANAKPNDSRFPPSFVKTVEQGAATTVWCATSQTLDGKGGVYCADCDISPLVEDQSEQTNGVRRWAVDEVAAEKLWDLSIKMTAEK